MAKSNKTFKLAPVWKNDNGTLSGRFCLPFDLTLKANMSYSFFLNEVKKDGLDLDKRIPDYDLVLGLSNFD